MKVLMYGSLIIAFACIGLYIIARYSRNKAIWGRPKRKKIILFGGTLAYFVFFSLAFYLHEQNKASLVTLTPEAQVNVKRVLSASAVSPTQVANTKLKIKVRTVPNQIMPNKNLILQFLVTNESKEEMKDLRMNFLEGNLANSFLIENIKGNSKVHLLENIVTLGAIKPGESKQLEFDLVPKNIVDYSATIAWQTGNNYILGEDNKPLQTKIKVEVAEAIEVTEDPDFSDFKKLKPVEEIEEPQTESNESIEAIQEADPVSEQLNEAEPAADPGNVNESVYE